MKEYTFPLMKSLEGELLLFRTLWNNSNDNMFIVALDAHGDFIAEASNASLEKTFNLESNKMNGIRLKDMLDDKTYKTVTSRYKKCMELNKPISYEESAVLDNEERFWNTTILPVINKQDGSIKIFGYSKEFTKLKNTQKELESLNEKLEDEVKQRTRELEVALLEMQKLSTLDALTGIFNRRYFDDIFSTMINSAKRKKEFFNFLMIDIDFFKEYNDNYGHQAGDDVIIKISDLMKKTFFRADDASFRLGGEEFGVIFNTKEELYAIKLANKLKQEVYDLQIDHQGSIPYKVISISLGLVSISSIESIEKNMIYHQADQLLYKAKQSGRNKLESFTSPLH